MKKLFYSFFITLLAAYGVAADVSAVTSRTVSPSIDKAQTLGMPLSRWSTVYALSLSDGEGSSFAVADVGEATRFAAEKNHSELTAESRAAANSHPIGAITGLSGVLQPATAASDGLMSSADKHKLDGVMSALDSKAPLVSPAFSGIPTVPTPAASDNSNQIASTAWARQTITSMGSVTRVLTVYVAPTGTDAVTTTGASNDPYATPGYALDQIRIKNPGRISRVALNIAAGVYNSTINLVEATPYAIIDRLVISGAGRDATTIASDTYIDLRYVAVDTLEMNDFTFEHSGTTTSITLRRGRITFTNIGVRRTNATSGAGLTLNAVDYFSCDGLSFEGNYTAVIQAVNGSTCTITGSNPIIFKSGSASSSIITCQTGSYVNIASSTTNSLSYEESWTNPNTPLRANSEGVIIPNSASTLTAWLAGGSAYTDAEPSFIKFYSTRAPLPATAAGIGQWVTVDKNLATYTLPAGGTWAYCLTQWHSSSGSSSASCKTGIAAGGTTITPDAVLDTNLIQGGFAWRIQ